LNNYVRKILEGLRKQPGIMRGLELHRILWIANLGLVIILGCILVCFILNKDNNPRYASSESESSKAEINLDKDLLSDANHRIILERNIFSSAEIDTVKKDLQKDKPVVQPLKSAVAKQFEFKLLGTVAGDDHIACAIIEDLSNKTQDLYRVGDVVKGASIEKIEQNKVVLLTDGRHEVLSLFFAKHSPAPTRITTEPSVTEEAGVTEAVKIISPTDRQINKEAFIAKVGGMSAVLNKVKLSPYIVDGKEKGIRINGLENINVARYVGFENGDVIQTINGQRLTNGRKAFQVFRKAQALSSSDIQLLRSNEKKTLSFTIE